MKTLATLAKGGKSYFFFFPTVQNRKQNTWNTKHYREPSSPSPHHHRLPPQHPPNHRRPPPAREEEGATARESATRAGEGKEEERVERTLDSKGSRLSEPYFLYIQITLKVRAGLGWVASLGNCLPWLDMKGLCWRVLHEGWILGLTCWILLMIMFLLDLPWAMCYSICYSCFSSWCFVKIPCNTC